VEINPVSEIIWTSLTKITRRNATNSGIKLTKAIS
jgi:hypothetical protein